jgi:O-antigen ligase
MQLAHLLLALVFAGSIVAGRAFSYLRIGPLFVTDAVLFVLLGLCALLQPRWLVVRSRLETLILVFVALAAVHLATALGRGMAALHDATLAGYSLFALVVPAIVARPERLERLVAVGVGAAVLLAGTALHASALGGTTGFFLGGGALALLGVLATRFRWSLALVVALLGVEMTLAGSRATLVGFVAGSGVLVLSLPGLARHRALGAVAAAACCGVVLAAIVASSASEARGLRLGAERFVSGTAGYQTDNTAQWRLGTWKNALRLVAHHPMTGVGFGIPVMVYAATEPPDKMESPYNYGLPHNTFITMALRMGIPGLVVLLLILGTWLQGLWRIRARSALAPILLALVVYACCYGNFALLFERPFMAMPFWTLVGLGMALERQPTSAPA